MLKESDKIKINNKETVLISSNKTTGLKVFFMFLFVVSIATLSYFTLINNSLPKFTNVWLYLFYLVFCVPVFIFLHSSELVNDQLVIRSFLNRNRVLNKQDIVLYKSLRLWFLQIGSITQMSQPPKYLLIKYTYSGKTHSVIIIKHSNSLGGDFSDSQELIEYWINKK